MHVRPRHLRAQLHNLRALGALMLVLSVLVYLNATAMADSAESAFRAASFDRDTELAAIVAAHQADLLRWAVLEYGSLLAALSGGVLLLAGPALRRAVRP